MVCFAELLVSEWLVRAQPFLLETGLLTRASALPGTVRLLCPNAVILLAGGAGEGFGLGLASSHQGHSPTAVVVVFLSCVVVFWGQGLLGLLLTHSKQTEICLGRSGEGGAGSMT